MLVQASVLMLLPSSQGSTPTLTFPSPQTLFLQALVQLLSSPLLPPSSHSSASTGPSTPSPQTFASQAGVQVPRGPLAESPYQTEMRHFAACLADGTPFLTGGDEATRSLALALAVLESVRTGRTVRFDDGWPNLGQDSTDANATRTQGR